MKYKLLVLDVDGTLLNDARKSVNGLLLPYLKCSKWAYVSHWLPEDYIRPYAISQNS